MRPVHKIMAALISIGVLAASAPAALAATYELAIVPTTLLYGSTVFRITVATGQTMVGTGGGAAYTVVADAAPLPSGDYHLFLTAEPETPDGHIPWSLVRMDNKSGRTWSITGCGSQPCTWIEMVAPH